MGFIAGILMERLDLTEDEAIEMGTAMEKEVIAKGSAVNEDAKFSVGESDGELIPQTAVLMQQKTW